MSIVEAIRALRDPAVKAGLLRANDGGEFESRFREHLARHRFGQVWKDQYPAETHAAVKAYAQGFVSAGPIRNISPRWDRHFMHSPYGSQQYPDFLLFVPGVVIPVETKYLRGRRGTPMWNGGIPREHGLYVIAAAGAEDLAFFLGGDVVSREDAQTLEQGIQRMGQIVAETNSAMTHQSYGFQLYYRRTYAQGRQHNPEAILDFLTNAEREELEDRALDYLNEITTTPTAAGA